MLTLARMIALLVGSVCAVFFFVFSLPLLARLSGDGPDAGVAGIGIACLLCALGIGLSVWVYRYAGQRGRKRTLDGIEAVEAVGVTPFTANARLVVPVLSMLALIAMFGFGLQLAIDKAHWPMIGLCSGLLLMLLFLSYGLGRQALRPGPMLTLNARGIDHAMYGFIPWTDVVGLSLQQSSSGYSTISNLMLGVRAPQRYTAQAPWVYRLQKRAWRRRPPAFGTLQVGLNVLDKKPELIHRAALAMRGRVTAPLLAHWHPAMSEHQVRTFLEMHAVTADMQALRDDAAPEQMEALAQRMTALQPDIDRAAQEGLDHIRNTKRNMAWLTGAGVVVFVLWLGSILRG